MKGITLIISGPTGVGKDTVANIIIEKYGAKKLTSFTTRPKRGDDKEGDYVFLTKKEYFTLLREGKFIDPEPVKIHGHYYGLSVKNLKNLLDKEKLVILILAKNIPLIVKEMFPANTVLVYLMPPSIKILKSRLKKRGVEKEKIFERLKKERQYFKFSLISEYDFITTNEDGKQGETVEKIIKFIRQKFPEIKLPLQK